MAHKEGEKYSSVVEYVCPAERMALMQASFLFTFLCIHRPPACSTALSDVFTKLPFTEDQKPLYTIGEQSDSL